MLLLRDGTATKILLYIGMEGKDSCVASIRNSSSSAQCSKTYFYFLKSERMWPRYSIFIRRQHIWGDSVAWPPEHTPGGRWLGSALQSGLYSTQYDLTDCSLCDWLVVRAVQNYLVIRSDSYFRYLYDFFPLASTHAPLFAFFSGSNNFPLHWQQARLPWPDARLVISPYAWCRPFFSVGEKIFYSLHSIGRFIHTTTTTYFDLTDTVLQLRLCFWMKEKKKDGLEEKKVSKRNCGIEIYTTDSLRWPQ